MFRHRRNKGKAVALVATACTIVLGSFCNMTTVFAKPHWPKGPNVSSESAVVMEINTGTVLYEKNPHEQHYPASITKILTTLLALEKCDLNETVVYSADAVYKNEGGTSNIARDYLEEMTMEQSLYGIMLESANECAYAVAEHVGASMGGDYSTFIDLMNKRAKELGCTDTNFTNCNGLPDDNHVTSAYDMALISCEAYKNEEFKTITGTKSYIIPPTNKHSDPTPLNNHHKILHRYESGNYVNEYCTGGKTGYTTVANSTLVTYAEKDGMAICVVVMDADSPEHWNDTNKLIDYSFTNFHTINIVENEKTLIDENSSNLGILNNNKLFVSLDKDAYIVVPNTAKFSEAEAKKNENVADKDVIASLTYTYAGREVGSVSLETTGAKVVDEYYSDKNIKSNTNGDIVIIKPIYILIGIAILSVIVVLFTLLKKFYDDYYYLKHDREMRKIENARFAGPKKKKRPRKKDMLFK